MTSTECSQDDKQNAGQDDTPQNAGKMSSGSGHPPDWEQAVAGQDDNQNAGKMNPHPECRSETNQKAGQMTTRMTGSRLTPECRSSDTTELQVKMTSRMTVQDDSRSR